LRGELQGKGGKQQYANDISHKGLKNRSFRVGCTVLRG
jgi:hypothetical protein